MACRLLEAPSNMRPGADWTNKNKVLEKNKNYRNK